MPRPGSAATARPQRVLAVAYGGGHVAMLLPVLDELRRRRPHLQLQLLALTTARRAALEAGWQPLGYESLLHLLQPAERELALTLGRELQAGNTHPDVPESETLAYLGINAWSLQRQLGPGEAARVLEQRGRQGFFPLEFMRRVLRALRPDLVLATNSPRSEHAALEAARLDDIPGVAVLDLFAQPGDPFAARSGRPTRVCVLADAVRDNLLAAGWEPERIAVTGNPAFDALHQPRAHEQARRLRLDWAQRWGRDPGKLVLLATQPEPRAHPASRWPAGDALPLAMEAAARAWVLQRAQASLVVRHHPNHWHRAPRAEDTAQVRFSVATQEPVEGLVLAADAVVVQSTTVGLQAAVAGRPVLSLQGSPGALWGLDYAALGVARGVPTLDDLPQALDRTLAEPPAPTRWARRQAAAPAVAEQIEQLLDRRAPARPSAESAAPAASD